MTHQRYSVPIRAEVARLIDPAVRRAQKQVCMVLGIGRKASRIAAIGPERKPWSSVQRNRRGQKTETQNEPDHALQQPVIHRNFLKH